MEHIVHHLRKIKRQPEEVRRHILHVLMIFFGIVLAALWVYSLGTELVETESPAEAENNLEPLSTFKDNIVDGYNSLSEPY